LGPAESRGYPLVVFWKFPDDAQDREDEDEENDDKPHRRVLVRGYSVFNAAQVDGFTPPDVPKLSQAEHIEAADEFYAALRADIRHGGAEAYYDERTDRVHMPHFAAFKDAASYYAVLSHELTHWTGAQAYH